MPSFMSIAIPPNLENFKIASFCHNSCIRNSLKNFDLNIVSVRAHTHLTGIGVSTKLVRNGSELGYLGRNKYFNYNFQSEIVLNKSSPVKLTKVIYCIFNSKDLILCNFNLFIIFNFLFQV